MQNQSGYPQVLRPEDATVIVTFEQNRMFERIPDEFERELESWQSSWRQESLEHYLPQGWSFGYWSDTKILLGYFLAQPILFYRGMTQTLWVERVVGVDQQVTKSLMEVAAGIAREKHFQKVLFHQEDDISLPLEDFKIKKLEGQIYEMLTAKIS